ncbi:hypothetical protein DFH07DRAFT_781723 [Mycena maculata]|uniref:Uncharacterized protein n=1 Tax=Mycena maculata TaxID=230809 RepID=A0AAD7HWS7_9AGAR|nr:hypothetical protein DFH07DRAFT_781723 [Mycena maculata]
MDKILKKATIQNRAELELKRWHARLWRHSTHRHLQSFTCTPGVENSIRAGTAGNESNVLADKFRGGTCAEFRRGARNEKSGVAPTKLKSESGNASGSTRELRHESVAPEMRENPGQRCSEAPGATRNHPNTLADAHDTFRVSLTHSEFSGRNPKPLTQKSERVGRALGEPRTRWDEVCGGGVYGDRERAPGRVAGMVGERGVISYLVNFGEEPGEGCKSALEVTRYSEALNSAGNQRNGAGGKYL